MALSGTWGNTFTNGYRVQLEWSATQSIANNTSTIRIKLYLMSMSGYHTISSSDAKTATITIAGSSNTDSSVSVSLSANQKKLVHDWSRTITHDADGTLSASLNGSINFEGVRLNGTAFNSVAAGAKTVTLNTIPRASSLSVNANWTAGSNKGLSISRASSSFTHTAIIYVGGTEIKRVTGLGTSGTASFSKEENTEIFRKLNTNSSASTSITLITYSGGTEVGRKPYNGTVTAPSESSLTVGKSFNIGSTISGKINRNNSGFLHTLKLTASGSSWNIVSNADVDFSYNSSAIASALYGKIPSKKSMAVTLQVYTYYNGVQVRDPKSYTLTANVVNSNPTFNNGAFTYKDINATTKLITGNDQFIIQSKSTVQVDIPVASKAEAINSATMARYEATLNGVTISKAFSSTAIVSFTFNNVDANKDVTLAVKAIDSRGNSTSRNLTVKIIPYASPFIYGTLTRLNSFENSTTLIVNGSISALMVNGAQKNKLPNVAALSYRYKRADVKDFPTTWTNIPYTQAGTKYTASNVTLNLDNLYAWNFEIRATDIIGSTINSYTVPIGKPILFIDTAKQSVGFNEFPVNNNEFRINGTLTFGGSRWGQLGAAIDMANGDIIGANSIFFNDPSDSGQEGINFRKTEFASEPVDFLKAAQWDNLHANNNVLYFNGKAIYLDRLTPLWEGGMYMTGGHTIVPKLAADRCPNGWIFVWSDVDPGSPTKINDFNWVYHVFPKEAAKYGSSHFFPCPAHMEEVPDKDKNPTANIANITLKQMYITNTEITGHDINNKGWGSDVVLRKILWY